MSKRRRRRRRAGPQPRWAIQRIQAQYKYRQAKPSVRWAAGRDVVGEPFKARVGPDISQVNVAELRLFLRTDAAFDLWVAMLQHRSQADGVCERALRWLNKAVPRPKGSKPDEANGGRYTDRQLRTACRTLEEAGLVVPVARRFHRSAPQVVNGRGVVSMQWIVSRQVRGSLVGVQVLAPYDAVLRMRSMARRGRPEGYRKPSAAAQAYAGPTDFFTQNQPAGDSQNVGNPARQSDGTSLCTALKEVPCSDLSLSEKAPHSQSKKIGLDLSKIERSTPQGSGVDPEILSPGRSPEADPAANPLVDTHTAVVASKRLPEPTGVTDELLELLNARAGRRWKEIPLRDPRWVTPDGINLRPWLDAPPITPLTIKQWYFLAGTPSPRRIREGMPILQRANVLAKVYRSAHGHYRPGEKCWQFAGGVAPSTKTFPALVAAAAMLLKEDLPPAAWARFAFNRWAHSGRGGAPPPTYVWNASQIAACHGWCRADAKDSNAFTSAWHLWPGLRELTSWYERGIDVAPFTWTHHPGLCHAIINGLMPGRAYADRAWVGHQWAMDKQAEFDARADAHEWLWELY